MNPLATLLWTVAIALLGLKLVATVVLLRRPPEAHLADRRGLRLWWATKIAPVCAVPCMIAAALVEHDRAGLWIWSLMMVFVAVAVPLKVWRRFGRVGQSSAVIPAQAGPDQQARMQSRS